MTIWILLTDYRTRMQSFLIAAAMKDSNRAYMSKHAPFTVTCTRMKQAVQKTLVIGGNGFIGSAVCKAALGKGMHVISVSSSGRPYQTAKGHTPAWTSKVDWRKGDALHPQTFSHLFSNVDGIVHTLGTLLEDGRYKRTLKQNDIFGFLRVLFHSASGGDKNPLEKSTDEYRRDSYEVMNRDMALRTCEAFVSSTTDNDKSLPSRPFVYISAEDVFRPVIPSRYVETKREAEHGIASLMAGRSDFRGVYIRPSLVYHAHLRPMSTPAAALLDLSVSLQARIPQSFPTPSDLLRHLGATHNLPMISSLESIANALSIPPIHVEHVAEAICVALEDSSVQGVVGVRRMRELIGWRDEEKVVS